LADLRIFRHDGDDAVRRDADESTKRGGFADGGRQRIRHRDASERWQHRLQQEATTCRRSRLQEGAARRAGSG